jgi:hypothetical protein
MALARIALTKGSDPNITDPNGSGPNGIYSNSSDANVIFCFALFERLDYSTAIEGTKANLHPHITRSSMNMCTF